MGQLARLAFITGPSITSIALFEALARKVRKDVFTPQRSGPSGKRVGRRDQQKQQDAFSGVMEKAVSLLVHGNRLEAEATGNPGDLLRAFGRSERNVSPDRNDTVVVATSREIGRQQRQRSIDCSPDLARPSNGGATRADGRHVLAPDVQRQNGIAGLDLGAIGQGDRLAGDCLLEAENAARLHRIFEDALPAAQPAIQRKDGFGQPSPLCPVAFHGTLRVRTALQQ
ncbi:MAG TPA: hypothetical protein VJQ81_07695 [Reyranella sp.]|nr:hypothetical protein [Reyranella sp.]